MRHLGARILIGIGRARRKVMGGTMNVRVFVFVEVRDAVDHALRLLRGRRVIQPDQRTAVDAFAAKSESRGVPSRCQTAGAEA